ncbi:hypothetical protein AB4Z54_09295 [Streptomyces sp. MCAF7]
MALRKTMPMAPSTRPDPQHETVYDPARGGHYPVEERPVPGAKQDGDAGRGRLTRGGTR